MLDFSRCKSVIVLLSFLIRALKVKDNKLCLKL